MLDSMLSSPGTSETPSKTDYGVYKRTDHATLLLHERAEVAEDLMELVNSSLNLADLGLPFLDHGLLEDELLW